MTVVGAGVIGIEYASVFAAIGVRVTVIERQARLLSFVDAEIIEALQYHLRELRVSLRFSETVTAVTKSDDGRIVTQLASGKLIPSDAVLYAAGRQGATGALELENAGLEADPRGRITVNETYQTAKPHIYAVGDVIGFPSLASTSSEQGRLAACHAFGVEARTMDTLLPFGIYTIPEISTVGRNEEELTDQAVPYVVGLARYREIARGQISGDTHGMLKLLVAPGHAQGARRPHLRQRGRRARARRPGRDRDERDGRLPDRHGLQLPDVRRGLQGGRARRDEPAERAERRAQGRVAFRPRARSSAG